MLGRLLESPSLHFYDNVGKTTANFDS
jgi:hypothetical protein